MKATITLTVTVDEDYVAAEALRRGKPPDVIRRELIASLECDLNDVCRWRRGHGVEAVGSRVQDGRLT